MRDTYRPLIVTLERDMSCPGGRPIATRVRPMTLLEYGWHLLRKRLNKVAYKPSPRKSINFRTFVGIPLTLEQYNCILGKDRDANYPVTYDDGGLGCMFIPPPEALPNNVDGKYNV